MSATLQVGPDRKAMRDLSASVLLHAVLFGSLALWLAWRERNAAFVTEIDLSPAPLVAVPQRDRPARSAPQAKPDWVTSKSGVLAQAQQLTETAVEGESELSCPAPCLARDSDWVPGGSAARAPQWVGGLIDPDEYPREALIKGQTGRVEVMVYVDNQGLVKNVRLMRSSHPALTELVLRKVKTGRFRPAYDAAGNAIPSKFLIPVAFVLD